MNKVKNRNTVCTEESKTVPCTVSANPAPTLIKSSLEHLSHGGTEAHSHSFCLLHRQLQLIDGRLSFITCIAINTAYVQEAFLSFSFFLVMRDPMCQLINEAPAPEAIGKHKMSSVSRP